MFGPKHVVNFHTEEEAKHEVMRKLFTLVFYGFSNHFVKRNIANLDTPSILWAAAKCIRHFLLVPGVHKSLQSLTAERRPLLNLLEERIESVGVSQSIDLSKRKSQTDLYVLHRLLDHGLAKKLTVHVQCPVVLAWLLHGRGSQCASPELTNLMHSKTASASDDGASCSPRISRLGLQEIRMMKSLRANAQSWIPCVRRRRRRNLEKQTLLWTHSYSVKPSLHVTVRQEPVHGDRSTVWRSGSVGLTLLDNTCGLGCVGPGQSSGKLSESSRSSLTDLSISVLPYTELLEILLDASPKVTSLHVEIQTVMWGPRFLLHHSTTDESELPLQKLTVKVGDLQTDLHFITSVLRRSPHLTSFHVSGMRLPIGSSQSQLLNTLSESNHSLRSLNLEDMKLSDCHPAILNLLRDCRLEELRVNDCRLLERCSNKEESLQQLVCALKTLPSLHTLSLAQNRLAKNVSVLAELFSGGSPSSVRRLDISSNFIQPADLLEFAERLRTHRPPHQLTLDLRKNPGDRDPDTWNAASAEAQSILCSAGRRMDIHRHNGRPHQQYVSTDRGLSLSIEHCL
ncbi:Leucine-rich repeat-containing protein 41 [Larimichthys crocea]|uniref:Uncharacterized protein n=1 Tax=Larimichthys crocea TaxID=215358 RepID=A0ACD3RLW6_LARCR|nr:Leucine-rich repeat-containing protein 41 [Larimichthys crocea]